MRRIILASQSPRRREFLTIMGLDYDVIPSSFEEALDDSRTPSEVAIELALGKATNVALRFPDAIVIGADTIVTVDATQLEKPKDEADAKRILKLLAGKANQVTTGLAVVCINGGIELTGADTTNVYFKEYNESAVSEYIATGDPMDKAGAYGIQSGAASLVSYIEGDYDTVMGLPTKLLSNFLKEFGIASTPVEPKIDIQQR